MAEAMFNKEPKTQYEIDKHYIETLAINNLMYYKTILLK